ncbi:MAG: NAD(P)H-hydrate dehydratase [Oligoflexia bacterium]|nr:NAD(P)H-hydrate dehydratase [Oligoflexia bacterium]
MSANLRICSSAEMRELDRIADREYGLDATLLMENAGRAASQILLEKYPLAGQNTEILIFAGKGNNAGDAFVVARRLICLDRKVRIFHFHPESGYRDAVLRNFQILKKMKAKLVHLDNPMELQAFFESSPGPFTIVDGILGTGFKGDLEGIYYDIVELINKVGSDQVVSLDIPTGISGDTGSVGGTSIMATLTISFGFPKLGHFLPPGAARRGELINVDISLPPRFRKEGDKFLLMRRPLAEMLKERDRYGHKNAFGHSLLIGGSPGRIGAIAMTARACHKMGTGLVTVASWQDSFEHLIIKLPNETMVLPIHLSGPEYEQYKRSLNTYSSIVVGPGLGMRPEGKQMIEELLQIYSGPMVIDADALNLIADHRLHDLLVRRRGPTVLTPHPGEMARFLGVSKDAVVRDPVKSLKDAVAITHATVVLKGAATLISSPDDVLYLNHYPNDGMATAGSGDVLAGMIGGFLGQGIQAFPGTLLGVYLHSVAGDHAAKNFGHRSMTAQDIIENIFNAFKEIKAIPDGARPMEGRAKLL